ncbi:MAG: indole-3-glycerol phosphate synthase TrpC [Actinomycetaceae bacterium]|nr:indole-3-glycerol phosphate synthase TrpC [Actinomycetaceae bacterium]
MNMLQTIVAKALADMHDREKCVSMEQLKQVACHQGEARNVIAALKGSAAVSIIAELKRACPEKGDLAPIPDPAELAGQYEAGGASVISCVTEHHFYKGSLEDFRQVRANVDIPLMRKDFIVHPYQVHEARAYGADMVTLIVKALPQNALVALVERTHSLGMTALVEAHSRLEALRALEAGAKVVGINARDLATMDMNMENFAQIVDVIPEGVVAVAESGVRSARDVFDYASQGADAIMIGEALVTTGEPRQTVADMVAAASHPALDRSRRARIAKEI